MKKPAYVLAITLVISGLIIAFVGWRFNTCSDGEVALAERAYRAEVAERALDGFDLYGVVLDSTERSEFPENLDAWHAFHADLRCVRSPEARELRALIGVIIEHILEYNLHLCPGAAPGSAPVFDADGNPALCTSNG